MKACNIYPRFISHTPCKKDCLKGESHEKLADSISNHIKEGCNELSPVIAIEGAWGSGKSNIIELVKRKLEEQQCKFYLFDLWQYQDDLNSNFFIQKLIYSLSDKNDVDGCKLLRDKLEKLHSEVKVNSTKTKLKYSKTLISFVLFFLVLSPLTSLVIGGAKTDFLNNYQTCIYISYIVILAISLIVACCSSVISDFLSLVILRKPLEQIETTTTKTARNTIYDNQAILKFLSEKLNGRKLVIALDNMDRIQSNAIDKVWTLMHALTSGSLNNNVDDLFTPWFIVSFDRAQIKCDTNKDEFLEKAFPVVYKVPVPIFTDYKEIFEHYFSEAFNDLITRSQINKIRIYFNEANSFVSIRTIVSFINQLVSIKKSRKDDDCSIESIAIYLICKTVIEASPEEKLLSGCYLSEVPIAAENIKMEEKQHLEIEDDSSSLEDAVDDVYAIEEEIKKKERMKQFDPSCEEKGLARLIQPSQIEDVKIQIIALHYGLSIEDAKQLILFDKIKQNLDSIEYSNEEYSDVFFDYSDYSEDNLIRVLSAYIDIVKGVDLDKFIYFIDYITNKLKPSLSENSQELWEKLSDKRLSLPIFYYYNTDTTDLLLKNLKHDSSIKKKIIERIVSSLSSIRIRMKNGWSIFCYTANKKLSALYESKLIDEDFTFKIDIKNKFEMSQYIAAAQGDYVKYLDNESSATDFAKHIINSTKPQANSKTDNFVTASLSAIGLFSHENKNTLKELREGVFEILTTECANGKKISTSFIDFFQIYKYFSEKIASDYSDALKILISIKLENINFLTSYISDRFIKLIKKQTSNNPYFLATEFAGRRRWLLSLIDFTCYYVVNNHEIELQNSDIPYFEPLFLHYNTKSVLTCVDRLHRALLDDNTRIYSDTTPPASYFIQALTPFVNDVGSFLNEPDDTNKIFRSELRDYWNR